LMVGFRVGQMYEIRGKLAGPNGKSLSVCTIWLTETETKSNEKGCSYGFPGIGG